MRRPQVVKLLQKFHRNNYIEDVRGGKYNDEVIDENNRLFRYVSSLVGLRVLYCLLTIDPLSLLGRGAHH